MSKYTKKEKIEKTVCQNILKRKIYIFQSAQKVSIHNNKITIQIKSAHAYIFREYENFSDNEKKSLFNAF